MFRTLFYVGVITLVGLVALRLVFGLLGPLVSLLIALLWLAARIVLVGAVVYFVIRIVSPATAQRIERVMRG